MHCIKMVPYVFNDNRVSIRLVATTHPNTMTPTTTRHATTIRPANNKIVGLVFPEDSSRLLIVVAVAGDVVVVVLD